MADIIADGLDQLTMTGYLNALEASLRIAVTDQIIMTGATVEIPIETLTKSLLPSGSTIILLDIATGARYELTTDTDTLINATKISIDSYNIPDNLPIGCPVYYKVSDIINYLYFAP